MRSQSQHQFAAIPNAEIERSVFDRSSTLKTTFDSGQLVPIFIDEALPGDSFSLKQNLFIRFASPLKIPVMDNVYLDTFYFAVPMRILWDNFKRFMGETDGPGHVSNGDYLIPVVKSYAGGFQLDSLFDHFGVPVGDQVTGQSVINALPIRAYKMIWNEWFRHQDLQEKVEINTGDGPDDPNDQILYRNKRHDYFSSCLPYVQKGDEVDIPIGESVPVYGTGMSLGLTTGGATRYGLGSAALVGAEDAIASFYGKTVGYNIASGYGAAGALGLVTKDQEGDNPENTGLYADLTQASAISINQLRMAFQTQRLLERDARGGTRYTEIVRSHFKVVSPDARLQRPEYLGGSTQRFNVNPVQQTSATAAGLTPQANLAAFGLTFDNKGGFHKSFTEHCYIIGIANVRCDLTYQYALNKLWSRRSKYDFYWPAFAHLGEQAVYNREIYHTGWTTPPDEPNPDEGQDGAVFGYQERWAEYRYKPNIITSYFRSGAAGGSLDIWHLAQEWTYNPGLSEEFMAENPPIDRMLAVPGTEENPEPQFLMDAFFQLKCARPMPTYSVPGLIDHF